MEDPQPPTIKDLDAAFNISSVTSQRKPLATAMERMQAALEGFSEHIEQVHQGFDRTAAAIEAQRMEAIEAQRMEATTAAPGYARGGRVEQSMTVVPDPQFRQMWGVDLARDAAPVAFIDNGGFYHAAPSAALLSRMDLLNELNLWAGLYSYGPDVELMARLNQRLRGEDPGQPVNWPGLEEAQRRLKDRRP